MQYTDVSTQNKEVQVSNYERALLMGDLSKLSDRECEQYYLETCKSMGLNPLTRPFEYLIFNGQKRLYFTKAGAEQIRAINEVSVISCTKQKDMELGLLEVTAVVRDKSGREDMATACLNINGLSPDSLCLAIMKCETKAKRRATLSLCGLGFFENEPDELDAVEKSSLANLNQNYIEQIISLAERKGSDLGKIINHFGKSNLSELTRKELEYSINVLNKKPDIETVEVQESV